MSAHRQSGHGSGDSGGEIVTADSELIGAQVEVAGPGDRPGGELIVVGRPGAGGKVDRACIVVDDGAAGRAGVGEKDAGEVIVGDGGAACRTGAVENEAVEVVDDGAAGERAPPTLPAIRWREWRGGEIQHRENEVACIMMSVRRISPERSEV
jgi:hypothetical protein